MLVVDDDIDGAQTLFLLLLDMGHEAAYATDGRTAVQRALSLKPQYVFLDIGLPDLDGSEVAQQIRSCPGCEAAVIIAVTGMGEEHRLRMLKAGCDAFYVKPLQPEIIEAFLKP